MFYPLIRRAVTITAANNGIRFKEGANTATAAIAPGVYWLRLTGAAALWPAIKAALEAATVSANTYTPTLTIERDATLPNAALTISRATGADTFQILGAHASSTFDLGTIGWTQTNTDDDATAKVGTRSCSALWFGDNVLQTDEPEVDGDVFGEDPSRGGHMVGGAHSDEWVRHRWVPRWIAASRALMEARPTDPAATWEYFWRWVRSGTHLELARCGFDAPVAGEVQERDDATRAWTTAPTTIARWIATADTRRAMGAARQSASLPLYSWPITVHKVPQ